MIPDRSTIKEEAIELLKNLIATPSLSSQEDKTAEILVDFFQKRNIPYKRQHHNLWAYNQHFDPNLPTILLNSHHDTVRPNRDWTLNPYEPQVIDGKLFGLGSNDAGGALVSLLATFYHFYSQKNLKYNILMAATAEEETSGMNGISSVLEQFGKIDFAMVGEPTGMHLAIAEKGLLVLECIVKGKSGHAARNEGDNAILKAIPIIQWFHTYKFPKVSEQLGEVRMSVTIIQAGTQHNVVPAECKFTVDVRTTDVYSNEDTLAIIKELSGCDVVERSLRLKPSSISPEHPIVKAGIKLGRQTYGSPTISDQSLLNCPSLKVGPGLSERSHTANEFIYLHEIEEGIDIYISLLEEIIL